MLKISGKRIYLRDHLANDINFFHSWISDPAVMKFVDWKTNSLDESKEKLAQSIAEASSQNRKRYFFAVVEIESESLLGECGFELTQTSPKVAELGYFFPTNKQGRGYAFEAAKLIVKYGFDQLQIQKFIAECATENSASKKIMTKLGMKKESTFLKEYPNQGLAREKVRYSLQATDF